MTTYPVMFRDGHIFLLLDEEEWLIDTGAPTSFGCKAHLCLSGFTFDLPDIYMGIDAEQVSGFIGGKIAGVIGTDVLNDFDMIGDLTSDQVCFSKSTLELPGEVMALEEFMGIPIVDVCISGARRQMFFDTGAQISYFQDDSLKEFPSAGRLSDFFPGFGVFETETHAVDIALGSALYTLRCGTLPGLLGMTLMQMGTSGIVGNEILKGRVFGYFPRRGELVLS